MAVGIILGGAFGKIVSSLVGDIIMPFAGLLIGGVNFTDLKITLKDAGVDNIGNAVPAVTVNYGAFLQTTIDFIIIAFCIFMESLVNLGYIGLFLASFLASTIIPLSSDIILTGLIALKFDVWTCVIVATAGNFLGGLTTYGLGYLGKWEWIEKYFKKTKEDIEKVPELTILSTSEDAGIYMAMARNGREFFVTGHSEYAPDTLDTEYKRDIKKGLDIEIPKNYYKDNDPNQKPVVRWRSHATLLFTNWLNYFVYQETPFEKLVELLNPERNLSHSALFQVMFNAQHVSLPTEYFSGAEMEVVPIKRNHVAYDLELFVYEGDDWIGTIEWQYNSDLFKEETISKMSKDFFSILENVMNNPEQPLYEMLNILSSNEYLRINQNWNSKEII